MAGLSHRSAALLPLGVNLVGTILATAIVVMFVGPRAALGTLAIAALLPFLSIAPRSRSEVPMLPPPLVVACAFLAIYVLVSAAWSAAPLLAIYTAAIGFLVLALAWAAVVGVEPLSRLRAQKLANAVVIGFAIGLAFLFVEELTDDAVKLFFYKKLPFITRNPKHMVLRDTEVVTLAVYLSNRSMAIASLLLWPVLGLLAALFAAPAQRPLLVLIVLGLSAMASATILLSQHETSAIALAAGALVFAAAWASRRLAVGLVIAGWACAILLVIPMAHFAYDTLNLQKSQSLPFSARARIVLWKYTASLVPHAPIIGVGAYSTEVLDQRRGPVATLPDEPVALRTARHSHNIYLQVWYELGVIGAALLALIGASAVGAIRRLSAKVQPYALATFATSAAMAATSWSLWQEWFLAAFALAAVFIWLNECLRSAEPMASGPPPPG
jgi:O-antigen ligase